MTSTTIDQPAPRERLRLWPGVIIALLMLLTRFALPVVIPETTMLGVIGGVVGALAIVVWWLFFSRAPWLERLGVLGLMAGGLYATYRLVHESIANGMMGMMLFIFGIPVISLALVAATVAGRRLSTGPRRALIVAAIFLACGAFTVLRTGGLTGEGDSDLHWRWTPSPEERLLAQGRDELLDAARGAPAATAPAPPAAEAPGKPLPPASGEPTARPSDPTTVSAPATPPMVQPGDTPGAAAETPEKRADANAGETASARPPAPSVTTGPAWPGFRGPERDGIIRGVRIEADWSKSPPVELWRRPIGPGWSSFAVDGDLLYTQEQRGDDEIVACYRVSTGEPVWRHRDPVRFWESNGGAGPRATPTLGNGRVYAFGATGILNALDAGSGAVIWSRNVASETSTEVPGWGFSSSPLVIEDVVIVAADATLVGYDAASGQQRWVGPVHTGSYSSPHRTTIDGVVQVLLLGGAGVTSVEPASGKVLWEHAWPGVTIVQPALMSGGDVVVNTTVPTGGAGTRRLAIAHGPGGWSVEERWTSNGLKPYFNDFVLHKGHAYGFDGSILASLDLEDGKRVWKGGRYGSGQLMLLPDQDLLLVLSEEGELALVGATPDQFRELARFPAIEGKTWNHPAMVGDVLLVRNGEEMVAFRLSLAGR
jgi:outer membrane protein assembly factor BamB